MGRWVFPLAALVLPLCLAAELLPIRSYSTADGLAADRVNEILADSRGFVWFCTPEGLSRFDGYRFVNFGVAEGLPHRSANTMLETSSGDYLVGTPRGLCQFRAGSGKFTTYLPGNNARDNYIAGLARGSSGRIWCITFDGLFEVLSGPRFRRQSLPTPPPGQTSISIDDVLEDATGKVWLATRTGIYVIGKDGGAQHIPMGDRLQNVRAASRWTGAISPDSISSYRAIPVWQSRGSRPSNAGSTLNTGRHSRLCDRYGWFTPIMYKPPRVSVRAIRGRP
jgi:ligand-binding sensor domain-containing protein